MCVDSIPFYANVDNVENFDVSVKRYGTELTFFCKRNLFALFNSRFIPLSRRNESLF